ncbi:MAG: lamin tail domain-containing protein [Sphingobacteriaceae bacterium]
MNKCLLFLAFMLAKCAFGQLNDNFIDGDLTANPTWSGNGFQVNAGLQMQTSNSGGVPQTVNLITANQKVLNAVWEFYVQINIDPSANNQVKVYLVSDKSDLSSGLNGYFLQIGESGSSDSYDLFRQDGTNTPVKIIDGPAKNRVNIGQLIARVRVTRDINGLWELLTDISGGTSFVSEGSALDLKYISTGWFGVQCKYSATNSDKYIFDDFSIGNLTPDTEAPALVSASGKTTHLIEVNFNEPISPETALKPDNYTLNNGYGKPLQVKSGTALNQYELEFSNELNTNTYSLTVSNLSDFNFNTQVGSGIVNFNYVKPYQAQANDVVINEIFADPSPQIDLPALEFIELWNTTEFPISLDQWIYTDANTSYTFTNQSLTPHGFLILCALADVANFSNYGPSLGISPWPSLNNAGDMLTLKNDKGIIINKVNYTDSWYKDGIKKQGGWTLELINPKATCTGIQNWAASTDLSGGTPGKANSIYQANAPAEPLKLISANMLDELTLSIRYNRYVDSTSAAYIGNYNLNNGAGQPVSAIAIAPYFEEVQMKFANPLALGKTYTLTASQVSDCSGILLETPNNMISFFLAEKIKPGDLLINEVLFNPRPGGVDFVEIYNFSDHPLNLKDLRMATLNDKDSLISLKEISKDQLLIPSQAYRVVCIDPANIQAEYTVNHPENLISVTNMPAFNDDAGIVVLALSDSLIIDQFNYTEKMHFPLLKDYEGVALERSSFKDPTNEPGNFRSAAATAGFATPGEQNSQFLANLPVDEILSLESPTLSPDNDGFEDALTIHYQFAEPGLVANMNIYSDKGLLIRRLIKNSTLSAAGSLVWDGLSDNNERVPIGIYLIQLQVFDLTGKVSSFIKPCVVAAKMN